MQTLSTILFLVLIPTAATYYDINKLTNTELPCTVEIGLTGIAEVAAVNVIYDMVNYHQDARHMKCYA